MGPGGAFEAGRAEGKGRGGQGALLPSRLRPVGRVQLAKCFVCHAKILLFTYLFIFERERARVCARMLWGAGGSRERERENQHRTRRGAQSHEL